MHNEPHPLAGQTVQIRPLDTEPGREAGEPVDFQVEDWADRVFGRSWMVMEGHPASMKYAMRSALAGLPLDNRVLYGKDGGMGEVIHESEILADVVPADGSEGEAV